MTFDKKPSSPPSPKPVSIDKEPKRFTRREIAAMLGGGVSIAALAGCTPNAAAGAARIGVAAQALTGTEVFIVATDYSGADIGAQINAADADLGANPGIIVVPSNNYTISTQVVLSSGHALFLGAGLYDNDFDGGPIFVMKSNTIIRGVGEATVIKEPYNADYNTMPIIKDYDTIHSSSEAGGSTDLLVCDLQCLRGTNTPTSANQGDITFGNVKRAIVRNIYFNQSSGYGVCFGGSGNSGNHAMDCAILDSRFDSCVDQPIAVVNCRRFQISRNTILASGQRSTASTFIDVEMNTENDFGDTWVISDNIVDGRGAETGAGVGIQVTGGVHLRANAADNVANTRIGLIVNNVIYGDDYPTDNANGHSFQIGISIGGCQSVLVADNIIQYAPIGINVLCCVNATVRDNSTVNCGISSSAGGAIIVAGSIYTTVQDNIVSYDNALRYGGTYLNTRGCRIIEESGYFGGGPYDPDHNLFAGNRLYNNPVNTVETYDSDDVPCILTTGTNSRAFGNFINDTPVDDAAIANFADLRTAPNPAYGRASSVTKFVRTAGLSTPADGGGALFYWDDASTASDNGITVAVPSIFTKSNGRWRRAPSAPKMSTTARNALSLTSDDASLLIFNTTSSKAQMWDGSAWQDLW